MALPNLLHPASRLQTTSFAGISAGALTKRRENPSIEVHENIVFVKVIEDSATDAAKSRKILCLVISESKAIKSELASRLPQLHIRVLINYYWPALIIQLSP